MRKSVLFFFLSTLLFASDQERLKIAVLNLRHATGVSEGEAELISDRLRNEFFSTGLVDIMERQQMQEVLKEQGLQQSGMICTDEGCIVEIGRILGVKRLVSGSIGKLGSLFMINVRSIDVESGKVERVVSEDVRGGIEDVVSVIPALAYKITGGVPPPDKKVASTKEAPAAPVIIENKPLQKIISPEDLPCNGSFFLQQIIISKEMVGFSPKDSDCREIDKILAEAFSDALRKKIIPASVDQLKISSCATKLLQVQLITYKTKPAAFNQIQGTAKVAVSIFDFPFKNTPPLATITIEKTGARHWGESVPLINAFKEIAEVIEDDLRSKVRHVLK